jgi:hypothetical protein
MLEMEGDCLAFRFMLTAIVRNEVFPHYVLSKDDVDGPQGVFV